MNKIQTEWEKRSEELGGTYESVMFASFPKNINEMLHQWELKILLKYFPKNKNAKVLDLGCGYGRLSIPLAKKYKDTKFYGIDISKGYVKLFNKLMGKQGDGRVGDLKTLPYKNRTFDFVFVVTVLMYMSDKQITKLFSEIKRVLKDNGTVVIIENNASGSNYITGYGLSKVIKRLLKKENKHYVISRVFTTGEIETLGSKYFTLIYKTGCSLLTLLLPFLLIMSKLKIISSKLRLNNHILGLPSLYNAYIFKNKN